jgi:hypothetical protein
VGSLPCAVGSGLLTPVSVPGRRLDSALESASAAEKLTDLFHPSNGYMLEKIAESARHPDRLPVGLAALNSLLDQVGDLEAALERRGLGSSALPGVEYGLRICAREIDDEYAGGAREEDG